MPRGFWVIAVLCVALDAHAQQPAAILGEPGAVLGPLAPPVPGGDGPLPPLPQAPRRPQKNVGSLVGIGLLAARNGFPGYSAMWFPSQQVGDQPTDLGFVRQELSLFTPPQTVGPDTATLALGIRSTLLSGNTRLPDSQRPFPDQLWDVAAGVAFSHEFENRWTLGAVVNAGSASDRPFDRTNTLNATVFTYLSIPNFDSDAWIFSLFYSPVLDFPYPVPGIAYFWNPDETLQMNVGIPFFVKWKPARDLTLDLFYFPIRTVVAKVTWDLGPGLSTYAGFNWNNEGYFLADRANRGDRLYSYEMRLSGGVKFDLPFRLELDLSAGWGFDRFYFQGRRFADRNNDRINVEPGPFGMVQLRYRF